jgi:hypothetical protein
MPLRHVNNSKFRGLSHESGNGIAGYAARAMVNKRLTVSVNHPALQALKKSFDFPEKSSLAVTSITARLTRILHI